MPETKTEVFEAYLHWIYKGMIFRPDRKEETGEEWCSLLWRFWIRLWIAGDMLCDGKLRNAVASVMQEACRDLEHVPDPEEVTWPVRAQVRTPPSAA